MYGRLVYQAAYRPVYGRVFSQLAVDQSMEGYFSFNGRPVYGRVFSIYMIDWSTKPPLDQSIEGYFYY